MLQTKCALKGKISSKQSLLGRINNAIVQIYPELEDLIVEPSNIEQNFKSQEYGYENVKVKAVKGESINITPKTEEQNFNGIFTNITVEEIQGDTLNIAPSLESQSYDGVYRKVNVDPIEVQELIVAPAPNEQNFTGLYNKVTVEGTGESENNAMLDGKSTTIGSSSTFDIKKAITYINEMDFSGMTSVASAFSELRSLLEIKKITNTSSATIMQNMFQNCVKIVTIPEFDTSNNTMMYSMFYSCNNLTNLGKLDASKVVDVRQAFYKCNNLTNFGGLINIGKAYNKATAIYANYTIPIGIGALTHDSLMNIINGLYDLNLSYNVANGGTLYTQQLTIGSTNVAKLTADEIAIATNKGWTVS